MKNFLHGFGGGLGRAFGRIVAIFVVSIIIYIVINSLHLDLTKIINKVLFLDAKAITQKSGNLALTTPYDSECGSGGVGYCATNTSNSSSIRQTGATYNGVLQTIYFDFSYSSFNSAYTYTLNIEAMSTDFRNNGLTIYVYGYNNYPAQAVSMNIDYKFVSKSKITITLPTGVYYPSYHVMLLGNPLTGISTYGIKKVYLSWDDGTQDISGIVNNANQNTSDIINNNNSNTEDIINNQNQNTQDIINSNDRNSMAELNNQRTAANSSCKNYYNSEIKYGKKTLTNQGVLTDSNSYSYYTEQYINIDIISSTYGDRIGIKNPAQSVSGYRFILYDSNFNFISTTNLANRNVTIPSNAQYFRFASPVSNTYIFRGGNCVTSTDESNDLLKDDSVDQSQANGFFNDFHDNNFGLSNIITLPLTTIQSLTSQSCVSLDLPIPFTNDTLTLPCMSQVYQDNVPDIYNMWQVVCYGLIGYWIAIDIFKLVKGFKDPDNDKIEVIDL